MQLYCIVSNAVVLYIVLYSYSFSLRCNLFTKVHEEKCCNLTHSLTVSNFRIVHGISGQDVEQRLLSKTKNSIYV